MVSFENVKRYQKLTQLIVDEITHAADQRISFAHFMELALLAPQLGYYQSTSNMLGERGDFTTASEISSLWGGCLARYCMPILKALWPYPRIVEIGAGTGRMAADLLLELQRLDCLPNRYIIVEVSDALRNQQQTNLQQWIPHLVDRIEYRAVLPSEPIEGVILANEVIDALPVHRFLQSQKTMWEYYVVWKEGQFVWQKGEVSTPQLSERLQFIQSQYLQGVEHYCSEINLSLDDWFFKVQASLKRGYIILVDYGRVEREYYHPVRTTGTLRCYYQQRCYTDPLQRVGFQDITSDVNFTQVATVASRLGLSVNTFVSQAAFLLVSGLLKQNELCYDNALYLKSKGQIHQLMSPLEMGEHCKVMVLERDLSCELLSLEDYDRRFSL